MTNFIFPSQAVGHSPPSVDVEVLLSRYATALDSLQYLERYHDALVLIRDHSTDLNAVALASNVLMGIQTDFAFLVYPARPKHQ